METSPSLKLPYIMPAQAQKHVTHNEAVRMLDGLVQISVRQSGLQTPPSQPQEGDRYLLGASPDGDWLGHDHELAQFVDGVWAFHTPQEGWLVWDEADQFLQVLTAGDWRGIADLVAGQIASLQNVDHVGVNSSADTDNRLTVASKATVLSHEGNSHRVTVNKAAQSDTASMVYSEDWSARAEIGLNGDNDLSIKTSPDGSQWKTVLNADHATGVVDFPFGLTSGGSPLSGQGGGVSSGLIGYDSGISSTGFSTTSTSFVPITDAVTYTPISQNSSLMVNLVFSGFVKTIAGLDDALGYLRPFIVQNGNPVHTYRQHLIGVQRMTPGSGASSNFLYLAIPATFVLNGNDKDQGAWHFGFRARCNDANTHLQGYGFSWTALEIEA